MKGFEEVLSEAEKGALNRLNAAIPALNILFLLACSLLWWYTVNPSLFSQMTDPILSYLGFTMGWKEYIVGFATLHSVQIICAFIIILAVIQLAFSFSIQKAASLRSGPWLVGCSSLLVLGEPQSIVWWNLLWIVFLIVIFSMVKSYCAHRKNNVDDGALMVLGKLVIPVVLVLAYPIIFIYGIVYGGTLCRGNL